MTMIGSSCIKFQAKPKPLAKSFNPPPWGCQCTCIMHNLHSNEHDQQSIIYESDTCTHLFVLKKKQAHVNHWWVHITGALRWAETGSSAGEGPRAVGRGDVPSFPVSNSLLICCPPMLLAPPTTHTHTLPSCQWITLSSRMTCLAS